MSKEFAEFGLQAMTEFVASYYNMLEGDDLSKFAPLMVPLAQNTS